MTGLNELSDKELEKLQDEVYEWYYRIRDIDPYLVQYLEEFINRIVDARGLEE